MQEAWPLRVPPRAELAVVFVLLEGALWGAVSSPWGGSTGFSVGGGWA